MTVRVCGGVLAVMVLATCLTGAGGTRQDIFYENQPLFFDDIDQMTLAMLLVTFDDLSCMLWSRSCDVWASYNTGFTLLAVKWPILVRFWSFLGHFDPLDQPHPLSVIP